jgi:hypothetical protein
MRVGGERVRTATSSILELVQKEGSKMVCRSVKICQFFAVSDITIPESSGNPSDCSKF